MRKFWTLSALAAALALVMAASGLALTKRTLTDGSLGTPGSSLSMKVEINRGEVKRIKAINIKNMEYLCQAPGEIGGLDVNKLSTLQKGPFTATHINGHPNLFKSFKIGNLNVRIGFNMPNEQGKRAEGSLDITGKDSHGHTGCNGQADFVAKP